jgi:hypothetical protein
MKFVWVPSTRRYRRTETEVKKEKLAYEVVEFETDKDSLIDRFNAYEERIEALEAQIRGEASPEAAAPLEEAPEPSVSPPPPPVVAPAPPARNLEREEIEDKILESTGAAFGAYLSCAISRLGELGREGWSQFAAFRHFCRDAERSQAKVKHKHIATFDERGLRYLALMQVRDLDNGAPLE